ncbi:MAG: hypothetical protein Q7T55_10625 [Solirubrobacteraceae bacterium]|nr:hypothetical protein [Solirubrobacteraceae bacterium]
MPSTGTSISTAAAIALAALALPSAASAATATTACVPQPTTKAFAKFGDTADYSVAPGGNFESTAGWTLKGGAKLVSGNESLGVLGGSKSLSLPLGATATSPAFCVDETNPHFRFASKPDNAVAGYAAVVLYRDSAGKVKEAKFTSSAFQAWGAGKWAASSISPLATKIPLLSGGGKTASVQIMFVSTGNPTAVGVGFWGKFAAGAIGKVSIDSLMIDPYRRG